MITESQVKKSNDDPQGLSFYAEASTLGLKPGEWRSELETDMGTKEPFRYHHTSRDGEGDVLYVCYMQGRNGLFLTIFND